MSEWEIIPFYKLLEDEKISYGIVQPGAHKTEKFVPIIRVNNLKDGRINTADALQVASEIEKKHSKTRLKGGELLIAVVGNPGDCAIVPENLTGWNVARAISVARINKNASGKFIYYAFKTEDIKHQMYGNTNDTVQPTLNLTELKQLNFTLPPLKEQHAIAEVLSSLDDKIDLLHRNNKTLEEMAETLFRQWFVDDNTEMWSTVGDEFDVVMGQSPPGNTYNENEDGVPFYQGRTDFTLRFPSRRIFCSAPSRMAMAMDTLLSVRAPVGDTNIASEECCIGRGLAAIRHKDKTLHYSYTFLLFNFIKESFDVHEQSGTVFGSISKNELLALKCPRLSEPLMFNEKIAVIEDKVTHNSIQIEALSKLRNTLLPKLMSGTVRVKH